MRSPESRKSRHAEEVVGTILKRFSERREPFCLIDISNEAKRQGLHEGHARIAPIAERMVRDGTLRDFAVTPIPVLNAVQRVLLYHPKEITLERIEAYHNRELKALPTPRHPHRSPGRRILDILAG